MHRLLVTAVSAAFVLVLPASAHAWLYVSNPGATLTLEPDRDRDVNDADAVSVTADLTGAVIVRATPGATAGIGCTLVGAGIVRCAPAQELWAELGGGDDNLTVDGMDGGRATVWAGAGDDTVDLSAVTVGANSWITGDGGNDELLSGLGDMTIDGGTGADHMDGATVTYGSRTAPVAVDLGASTGGAAGEADSYGPKVANVIGGGGDDHIAGNAAMNTLSGGLGDDTLVGGAGRDIVYGDYYNTYGSQAGNDMIWGDQPDVPADQESPGDVADELYGDGRFFSVAGDDAIYGGGGGDRLYGDGMYLSGGGAAGSTAGDDWIHGGPGDDRAYGEWELGSADDKARWRNGSDMIFGGEGNDWLMATDNRTGDGTLSVLHDSDFVDGGPGADTVSGGPGDDELTFSDTGTVFYSYAALRAPDSGGCGAGSDVAQIDALDEVGSDCESVNVPDPAPPYQHAIQPWISHEGTAPRVGETVRLYFGGWRGTSPITVTDVRFKLCSRNVKVGCVTRLADEGDITFAVNGAASLTIAAGDVDRKISASFVARNVAGSAPAQTAVTPFVTAF